ncbi:MAG: FKBP-type peptidyl-prolyl cis-trans isomerase [Pseudomonadales bacterium]|nr:FKBP-type peptidyl-prolyl cis-trans isomerase [Pseudomonadales bacterium]
MTDSFAGRALGVIATAWVLVACQPAQSEAASSNDNKTALTTEIEQASYRLGYDQAGGLLDQTLGTLDIQAFAQGVADAAAGNDAAVSESERQRLMQVLQSAVQAAQASQSSAVIDAGKAFRDEFAQREGVQQTESGLLYQIMVAGDGAKPALTDTVSTHYHGTLATGEVFDSSVERGQPASFAVNQVIRGWTEALQLMGVGSKWRLVIPPELAYGERGAGGKIGPHATLMFEVELLEIK